MEIKDRWYFGEEEGSKEQCIENTRISLCSDAELDKGSTTEDSVVVQNRDPLDVLRDKIHKTSSVDCLVMPALVSFVMTMLLNRCMGSSVGGISECNFR